MSKTFVILGGSFAAKTAAGWALENLSDYKIIMISPSDEFLSVPSTVRLVVQPELVSKAHFSIPEEYGRKYSADKFQFIHTAATSVDPNAQTVHLLNGLSPLKYDVLIVATGTKASTDFYKLSGSWEDTESAIRDASKSIEVATKIAVVGAGPTGIETAAEIVEKYGKSANRKNVTIFTGKATPMLEIFGKSRSKIIINRLQKMGVNVVVETVKVLNKHILVHSDGTEETYDFIIPAVGITPNSDFFPIRDQAGYIPVDSHLRVKGLSNVYAIGDIVSDSAKTIVDIEFGQKKVLFSTLKHDIISPSSKLQKYDPEANRNNLAVTLGTKDGVGLFYGVPIPSFLISFVKGKDFRLGTLVREWGP